MSGPDRVYLDADADAQEGVFPRCFANPKYCSEPAIEYVHIDEVQAMIAEAAVKERTLTVQDAARVPEIAALLALMAEVVPSLEATNHNISLCKDLRAALRAIAEGK